MPFASIGKAQSFTCEVDVVAYAAGDGEGACLWWSEGIECASAGLSEIECSNGRCFWIGEIRCKRVGIERVGIRHHVFQINASEFGEQCKHVYGIDRMINTPLGHAGACDGHWNPDAGLVDGRL